MHLSLSRMSFDRFHAHQSGVYVRRSWSPLRESHQSLLEMLASLRYVQILGNFRIGVTNVLQPFFRLYRLSSSGIGRFHNC